LIRVDIPALLVLACKTGHRIPAIENLGVAGPHDAFDFTDNDIAVLGNFPLSPRVRTLLLARNRIAAIQPSLPAAIPNLKNLVLASNNLAELADLDVLGKFGKLTHLVLADNPVTKKEVCELAGGCEDRDADGR
jgi:U2 small nuclear ribonucleoprotein A'